MQPHCSPPEYMSTTETISSLTDDFNNSVVEAIVRGNNLVSDAAADAIRQVTVGVDQISSVVQTYSATAEETAASEELTAQADGCKELIRQFTLRND